MKTIKTKLLGLSMVILATVFSTSCSKNNPLNPLGDCGTGGWAQKVSKELNDWSVAASNYSMDQTTSNCNAYKSAAKNYLDALEGVRGCVLGASQAEFNEAIDEAKKDIDETNCDG